MVDRRAVDDRVAAGGVVADHAAERGPVGGRGVGAEAEAVAGHGAVEVLLHDARADAHAPRRRVDLADRVHVARGVEHEPLARRSARPGWCRRRGVTTGTSKRAAARDGGGDVGGVAREGHQQRRARVQARVAREQMARVVVGAHLAAQLAARAPPPARAERAAPGVFTQEDARSLPCIGDDASQRTALPPDPGAHERPGPRPAGDRRADDRPPRAGLRPPRPRGPRGPARGLQDERPGRRLPRLRHRRVGGGARQHAVARRPRAGVRDRPLRDAVAGDGRAPRARGRVGRGRLAPRRRPRARRRDPRADANRRSARSWSSTTRPRPASRAASRRSARRSTPPATTRCCSSTSSPRSARSTTATRNGASTSPSAAPRRA